MPLIQNIERALFSSIGEGGIADSEFDVQLEKTEAALDWVRKAYADNTLPLLRLPETTDDLPPVESTAKKMLAGATDLVFMGTGGSGLGAQALLQLADYNVPGMALFRPAPRLHFLDNLDPLTLDALLKKLPLKTTHFLAVSKSGGTGETLMQAMADIAGARSRGPREEYRQADVRSLRAAGRERRRTRFALCSSPTACRSSIITPASAAAFRFSPMSGFCRRKCAGLDIDAVRAGAAAALKPILDKASADEVPSAVGAALSVAAAKAGKNITVLMAYADRLERTTAWWVQLWSESLGKDGSGTTPVRALGPVDQHSQLQLHLGGPKDKLFTVVTTRHRGKRPEARQGCCRSVSGSRALPARRSAISSPRRAAPRRTPWPRTVVPYVRSISARSTSTCSANS